MNAEYSSVALAQAALLLSFWTPPGEMRGRRPNTSWLVLAIHQARNEDAHLYHSWSGSGRNSARRTLWKRIWWCCIIRDRVLSLGLRRPPQITRDNFDFECGELMTDCEFRDEIENSRVYSPQTKLLLTHVLLRIVELCVILTDLHSMSLWLETPYCRKAEIAITPGRCETSEIISTELERDDSCGIFSVTSD